METPQPLVLVVDDEEAARFAKAETLRRAGFEVVEASTGRAGLELASRRLPDVVVLDVNLPDISGFEVARRLKADQPNVPGLPILQISNSALSTADRVHGLEIGADVYLTEPVAGEILVATVRSLLRARRAERALAASLAREREARSVAEEASRLKDEFIATLSHELRTPLNAVMGWIFQLRHSSLDERTRSRALDSIERNTRVQAQLINDLLDISRISKGKLHLRMQLLDVRAVVNDAIDSVRDTTRRKGVSLSVTAPSSCRVLGDYARLQQIVTNLLTNAVQFTPEHGTIEVDVRPVRVHAQITVTDSGAGIDEAFLPHVFDQFRQGEGGLTRKHGGLGLGLAVVRQLVELHDGSVEVASQGVGKGATFTILLPLELESPTRPLDERGEPVLKGLRVLVVHPAAADLAHVFEASGADVDPCDTFDAAAAAAAERQYDVIVGDLFPAGLELVAPLVPIGESTGAAQLVRRVVQAVRTAQTRTTFR